MGLVQGAAGACPRLVVVGRVGGRVQPADVGPGRAYHLGGGLQPFLGVAPLVQGVVGVALLVAQ